MSMRAEPRSKMTLAIVCFVLWGINPAWAGNLRVLSLNVFAGNQEMDFERLERQLKAVEELRPDIVCLQEVYDHRVKEKYVEYFPRHEFMNDARVSGSSWIRDLSLMVTMNYGQEAILNGFLLDVSFLLNRDRGRVVPGQYESFLFHFSSPEVQLGDFVESSWAVTDKMLIRALERVKPKGFITTRYTVDGVSIRLANMRLSNGVVNPLRFRNVVQVANEMIKTDEPAILCGDTNSDGEQDEMVWLRSAGFRDTYLEAHPNRDFVRKAGMTWSAANDLTRNGHLIEPDQRVDYVIYHPGVYHTFETVSSEVVFDKAPFVSDHFGVLTELKLIPRPLP